MPLNLIAIILSLVFTLRAQADIQPDCSSSAITAAAMLAYKEQTDEQGRLWGTKICTPATRATVKGKTYGCFNACALVVSAILKRAGCKVSVTSGADVVWNAIKASGAFVPSKTQKAGCLIGMNSRAAGSTGRLTLPGQSGSKVAFRHVAIAVGSSAYVDNYSLTDKAYIDYNGFFDWTKYADIYYLYSPFIYLCPAK